MTYKTEYYNYAVTYDSETAAVDVTNTHTGRKVNPVENGCLYILFIDGKRRKFTKASLLRNCFPDNDEFQSQTPKRCKPRYVRKDIKLPDGRNKEYVDYYDYRIFNNGNVINTKKNREMTDGKVICLSHKNHNINMIKSRMIYEIFNGPLEQNEVVMFYDGNEKNCDYRNLYSKSLSKICKEKRNMTKLDREGIYEMYTYIKSHPESGLTVRDIMNKYNCSHRSVYNIVNAYKKGEKEKNET